MADETPQETTNQTPPAEPSAELADLKAKLEQANSKLKQFEKIEAAANQLSPTDLSAGIQKIQSYANTGYQVGSSAELNDMVQKAIANGGQVPKSEPDRDEGWVDPEVKALREELAGVRGELSQVRGSQYRSSVESYVGSFLEGDIGRALTDEEKKGVMSDFMAKVEEWGRSDAGVNALKTLNAETFDTLAIQHLRQKGIFTDVMKRLANAENEMLGGFATDGPSRVPSNSAEEKPDHKGDALAALKHAAFAKAGIRL